MNEQTKLRLRGGASSPSMSIKASMSYFMSIQMCAPPGTFSVCGTCGAEDEVETLNAFR